jgi:hypothetical protein
VNINNYLSWNENLISYFLSGIPQGSKIYLTIDEDLIDFIGKNFLHLDHDINALDHFRCSVIDTIIEDEKVNLKNIQGLNPQGKPKCFAFLSLSVLAAFQMSEDDQEEISEKDYFTRLKSLLGLSGEGRPNGMKFGNQSEEILWKEWNLWLLQQGFQPTAYQGKGRSNKYIKYPISQTLFRQVDKDKLQELFIKKQWINSWDAPTLYSQVRHEINYLSKHIANLLRDRKRLELVADSLHEIHQQWLAEGCPKKPITKRKNQYILSRNLFAELYRTEDPFLGDIDYFIYPKQPKFKDNNEIKIQYHNQTEVLREDRQGWYLPCGSRLIIEDLNKGIIGTVINHNNLEKLIFPAREFWILIRDKEDEDSDIYATWGSPNLGEQFIILCKQNLMKDLQLLKDEKLLDWSEEIRPFPDHEDWLELHQCQVLSEAWEGIFPSNLQLKDALQPKTKLSISLKNGLKIPQQKAWLKDYPPDIIIYGFYPNIELEIKDIFTEQIIEHSSQKTNQLISVSFPHSTSYLVTAKARNDFEEILINLKDWEDLEIANINANDIKSNQNNSLLNTLSIL